MHVSLCRTNCRYCIHRAPGIRHRTLQQFPNINAVKLLLSKLRPFVHIAHNKILGCQPKCLINGHENEWTCNFPSLKFIVLCYMYTTYIHITNNGWQMLHFDRSTCIPLPCDHFPHLISF